MWSGSVDSWTDGNHLTDVVDRTGLDLAEMDQVIEEDPDSYITAIKKIMPSSKKNRPLGLAHYCCRW